MENNLKKLEKIINEIENSNSANDFIDSVNQYQDGIKILDKCKKFLKIKNLSTVEDTLKDDKEDENINLNILVNKIEKKMEKLSFHKKNINIDDDLSKLNELNIEINKCKKILSQSKLEINQVILESDKSYSVKKFE